MHPSTESSADAPQQTRSWFGRAFVIAVVLLNLLALGAAWRDQSFGAICIAIMIGPIGNGVLALVGLAGIPFLRRRPGFSMGGHLALSLGLPVVAIIVDAVAIFSMRLHGC
jgi:MYXO-CTERM domain-containing protein